MGRQLMSVWTAMVASSTGHVYTSMRRPATAQPADPSTHHGSLALRLAPKGALNKSAVSVYV